MGRSQPSQHLEQAIRQIDAENARDPNSINWEGDDIPYALFYSQRVSQWVEQLCPEASEALRIAARAQHICRWQVPRSNYPMDRAGYLSWRTELKEFHARKASEILAGIGYDRATIERVRALNLKLDLGRDPEAQALEDALCLVTLQYQLSDLMRKTEQKKLVSILRKTWRKMSPAGQEFALNLPYSSSERILLDRALST